MSCKETSDNQNIYLLKIVKYIQDNIDNNIKHIKSISKKDNVLVITCCKQINSKYHEVKIKIENSIFEKIIHN